MGPAMVHQVIHSAGCVRTLAALVWFFTGMGADVCHQRALPPRGVIAELACKGFLARVAYRMPLEHSFCCCNVWAQGAFQSFSAVGFS